MSGDRLHGRDAELEQTAAAVDAVARGGRSLVVVRGEAGIGKTALLAALRDQALARRFVVLEGRATELEREVPLLPLLDALEGQLPALEALAALGSGMERWRVHRAIGELLAGIADGWPLALLVDDVHWADPATQELLEHIVRRPPTESLLVAVGLRSAPVGERLLAAQRPSGALDLVTLDLKPLERAAADLVMNDVVAAGARERVFRQSGGNPLLLRELARHGGRDALPGGILAAVTVEVESLAAPARELVRAAAVVGDPFEFELAARIAGIDRPEALTALDVIEQRELVRGTGDGRHFAFRHPVVRTAVYEAIGAGSRLAGHAAAARELEHMGAPLLVRARHLSQSAVPGDVAAAATLRAGAAAIQPQAPGVAADWLLVARRVDPGGAEAKVLVATLIEASRLEAALEVVEEIAGAAADTDAAVTAASIERLLGRHDSARQRLEDALERAVPGSPEAARVLANLAVAAYQLGRYPAMRGWAERVGPQGANDAALRAVAATLLAVGDSFVGATDAAATGVADALAAVHAATDDELGAAAEPAMAISWGLLALDRVPEGFGAARRLATAARRSGNGLAAIVHDLAAVLALGLMGRMTEAEPAADDAEQAARVSGNPQLLQWTLWLRGWVLMECGRLDPALAAAEESVALAAELDDSASGVVARAVLGAVRGARGEHATARDLLQAYDIDKGWICRWAPFLVESDLALDDVVSARDHAGRAAALAPATGMAAARAAAGRAQALVSLAEGDTAGAATLALTAADEADAAGATLEMARDRLVAGRALLSSDRDAAIEQLSAARAQAARSGAPRVEQAALFELRRAGVRVGLGGRRASGTEGLSGLSVREREIAELVAEGLTNREIGSQVFLSEKTVETHLTHVFQKLGLRSRAQVAAAIARRD
jgi:DNA-binding NarL/FixJ family response regulator